MKGKKAFSILPILAAVSIPAFFTSCAFMELQKDLDRIAANGTIHGQVTGPRAKKAPVIMIAYAAGGKIVRYKHLNSSADYYAFSLPGKQSYQLAAFEDTNNNLKYDRGEPAALWANRGRTVLPATGQILHPLKLSSDTNIPSAYKTDISKFDKKTGDKFVIITGQTANIDDKRFSAAVGHQGLWTPMTFLEKYGLGVYFLEKYDPDKIPVLFIYGIDGNAQSWKYFLEHIDRNHFQPWFYFYPSGFRIGKSGKALDIIIRELQTKYRFRKMFVLAHSMGGLVARELVKRQLANNKNFIKLLITISTPWKGDKDAEWSKHAPAVIPCWYDLMPDSDLVKSIKPDDLGTIPYYLLFSYKGDRKPFRLNNDSVVYISSELKFDMQKRAEKVYGFNLKHDEMLKSSDLVELCNDIFHKYTPDNEKKNSNSMEDFFGIFSTGRN